LYPSRAEASRQ